MDYQKLIEINKGNPILAKNSCSGYRLNLNHPAVNVLYRKYREDIKIRSGFPLSDNERFDFEDLAINNLINQGILIKPVSRS